MNEEGVGPRGGTTPPGHGRLQLRYETGLTGEGYVRAEAWRDARLDRCPNHPHGECSLARHGTYARKTPRGTQIARWYCPESHTTFSLLPECLAARLPGELDTLEAVVAHAEGAASVSAAANALRRDPVGLAGAIRWVHPGDGVDASWSAVDEVTEGEETVAPSEEAHAREHRLECVELAVHVADHEITASGRIGSHAGERTLRLLPSRSSLHPLVLRGAALRCAVELMFDSLDAQRLERGVYRSPCYSDGTFTTNAGLNVWPSTRLYPCGFAMMRVAPTHSSTGSCMCPWTHSGGW